MINSQNDMDTKSAYNIWAAQYDSNENKTRDLEAKALREVLGNQSFEHCLEVGCGTGKNTEWLITKAKQVTAIDLSEAMLAKAKAKIQDGVVKFIQEKKKKNWPFQQEGFDLVTFSLVLEHIENLDVIFQKVSTILKKAGMFTLETPSIQTICRIKGKIRDQRRITDCGLLQPSCLRFYKAAARMG
jgi:ubiquinone/menaquinone biosynthesis C-methylase UbiE